MPLAVNRRRPHPIIRWWWPAGCVDETTIQTEIDRFQRIGFGGIEVQAFSLNLEAEISHRVRVGGAHFRKMITFAARYARKKDMTFHSTTSSGWPMATDRPEHAELEARVHFSNKSSGGAAYRAVLQSRFGLFDDDEASGRHVARVFHDKRLAVNISRVGRIPIGCALGKRVWVVDHLSPDAARDAFRVARKCVAETSTDILIDSFEMGGHLPISREFVARFKQWKRYDISPYIPSITRREGEFKYYDMLRSGVRMAISTPASSLRSMFKNETSGIAPTHLLTLLQTEAFEDDGGVSTSQRDKVRADYEEVRARLFIEFVSAFITIARGSGHRVRLQAHGGYGHPVDVYALSDVPETETLFGGSAHEFMLLAASATWFGKKSHTSCECMITLGVELLSESQMSHIMARAIVAGADQLVFHGMAYPLRQPSGKMWFPFSPSRALGGVSMSTDLTRVSDATLLRLTSIASRLASLMSSGHPHIDVLWLADGGRFGDAPIWSWDQLRSYPHESTVARELRRRGLAYAICSPQWLARARVDASGNVSIGHVTAKFLIVDDGLLDERLCRRLRSVHIVPSSDVSQWTALAGVLQVDIGLLLRVRRLKGRGLRFMCVNDANSTVAVRLGPYKKFRAAYLHDTTYDEDSARLKVNAHGVAVFDLIRA